MYHPASVKVRSVKAHLKHNNTNDTYRFVGLFIDKLDDRRPRRGAPGGAGALVVAAAVVGELLGGAAAAEQTVAYRRAPLAMALDRQELLVGGGVGALLMLLMGHAAVRVPMAVGLTHGKGVLQREGKTRRQVMDAVLPHQCK